MEQQSFSEAVGHPVVHVGPGVMLDFETGALLLSLLTYPKTAQSENRRQCFLALCARFAAEMERSAPKDAELLREARPEYFDVLPPVHRKADRTVRKALHDRMVAALIARPFIERGRNPSAFAFPKGLTVLNPTAVADWVAAVHAIKDKDNLLHRAWRPSLPVLHLAVALDSAMAVLGRIGTMEPPPDELIVPVMTAFDLQDIHLFRAIALTSHDYLGLIQAEDQIRIADRDFVRIQWHD